MVGNDAWTGCVVTVIDGAHIGNGAITSVGFCSKENFVFLII